MLVSIQFMVCLCTPTPEISADVSNRQWKETQDIFVLTASRQHRQLTITGTAGEIRSDICSEC